MVVQSPLLYFNLCTKSATVHTFYYLFHTQSQHNCLCFHILQSTTHHHTTICHTCRHQISSGLCLSRCLNLKRCFHSKQKWKITAGVPWLLQFSVVPFSFMHIFRKYSFKNCNIHNGKRLKSNNFFLKIEPKTCF